MPTPPGPHSVTTRQRCTALDDAREVRGAADEGAERHPRPGRPCAGTRPGAGPTAQLLAQHPPLQLPQLRRRVEPELVGEPGAQPGEGRQRVALPAGGDQRLHQYADGPLAQRLGGHQRLELGDRLRGPAHRQQRLRVLLAAAGLQLGQPRDLGLQRGVVQLGVRLAPPQRQRRAQTVAARDRVVERRGRGEMVRERRDVDAARSASSR